MTPPVNAPGELSDTGKLGGQDRQPSRRRDRRGPGDDIVVDAPSIGRPRASCSAPGGQARMCTCRRRGRRPACGLHRSRPHRPVSRRRRTDRRQLDPFALPIPGLPPGVGDYGSRVRIHGDHMAGPVHRGPPSTTATPRRCSRRRPRPPARPGSPPDRQVLSTREWLAHRRRRHRQFPCAAGGRRRTGVGGTPRQRSVHAYPHRTRHRGSRRTVTSRLAPVRRPRRASASTRIPVTPPTATRCGTVVACRSPP